MREGPDIARIASLVGDPARANMLNAMMGGTTTMGANPMLGGMNGMGTLTPSTMMGSMGGPEPMKQAPSGGAAGVASAASGSVGRQEWRRSWR